MNYIYFFSYMEDVGIIGHEVTLGLLRTQSECNFMSERMWKSMHSLHGLRKSSPSVTKSCLEECEKRLECNESMS